MRAQFITAAEVAEIMGISRSKAYQIVREMNRELKSQGYLTVAGKCPAQYFKQKFYGFPEVSEMTGNEKTTALIPSVGADGGQPPHNSTNQSIPHETCESNPPEENIEEIREKIRRMNDPRYLHTVSMTELYQTAYKSRPPVIDGLLYSGAYILAGAPKIGKSFLVAQLAYHVSTGQRL